MQKIDWAYIGMMFGVAAFCVGFWSAVTGLVIRLWF